MKMDLKAIASVLAAACAVGAAGYFSPAAGAAMAGFLALCAAMGLAEGRRAAWEETVSDKIDRIEKAQGMMGAAIEGARRDIQSVQKAVAKTESKAEPKSETVKPVPAPANVNEPLLLKNPIVETRPASIAPIPAQITAEKKERKSPTIASMPQPAETGEITDERVKTLAARAAQEGGVEMFLQPVVRLPARKPRYYELFARVRARPGQYLPAARYRPLAANEDAQGIDQLLLNDCLDLIQETAHIDRAAPFFINVPPDTLKSALYMRKLLNFLGRRRELAPRMVFEMTQRDFTLMTPVTAKIIDAMGKLGCAFSIDNVKDLNFDVAALRQRHIGFVKIGAKILTERAKTEKTFAETLRLKKRLEAADISMIAEKIETETELKEILDYDIAYGQGFLFGKPDVQAAYQQSRTAARG